MLGFITQIYVLSVDLLGWCRFHQVGEGEIFFLLQLLYEVWNMRTLTSWNPLGHFRRATGLLFTVQSYVTHEQVPPGRWIRRTFGRTLIQAPAKTPKWADLVTGMQSFHKSICGLTWLFSGYTAPSHKGLRFLVSNTYDCSKGSQIPPTKSKRHLNIPRQKRDTQRVLYWGPQKIRRYRTKSRCLGDLAPGICELNT